MTDEKKDLSTLLSRMEEVMRSRKWSARRWAQEAGLSESSHVSGLMRIMRKEGREYVGGLETWAALALAAGVNMDWLVYGRGEQWISEFPMPKDRYASRAILLGVAHALGFSDETIDAVARLDGFARDPGPEYWMGEMTNRERLVRQKLTAPTSQPPKAG